MPTYSSKDYQKKWDTAVSSRSVHMEKQVIAEATKSDQVQNLNEFKAKLLTGEHVKMEQLIGAKIEIERNGTVITLPLYCTSLSKNLRLVFVGKRSNNHLGNNTVVWRDVAFIRICMNDKLQNFVKTLARHIQISSD